MEIAVYGVTKKEKRMGLEYMCICDERGRHSQCKAREHKDVSPQAVSPDAAKEKRMGSDVVGRIGESLVQLNTELSSSDVRTDLEELTLDKLLMYWGIRCTLNELADNLTRKLLRAAMGRAIGRGKGTENEKKEKIKCPGCGMSVMVPVREDLKREEMLCNQCHEEFEREGEDEEDTG